jgi:DNA-directed RNA polymerase specialized sigma24 family protein
VATDLALNELRSVESQPIPEQLLDAPAVARRAVACLPGKQRAAVVLHKYHRMDYRQIAKVLNCRESAAKSLLFSAYETLRRRLALCGTLDAATVSARKLTGLGSDATRLQNELDPVQQIG